MHPFDGINSWWQPDAQVAYPTIQTLFAQQVKETSVRSGLGNGEEHHRYKIEIAILILKRTVALGDVI